MAEISASLVKQLRDMTGSGMMDCKKALTEAGGDMEKAVLVLREKGLAAAQKKAGRIAAEGLVTTLVSEDGKSAVIVEVNSESDFVAKNEQFQKYVADVAAQALESGAPDLDAFLKEPWKADPTLTVEQELSEKISIIGEKISIRRFARLSQPDGCIVAYVHGGGRIGVLVDAQTAVVNDDVREALKNVAMQITSMRPKYVSRDDVDAAFIEEEKEILKTQAMNENPDKPENIIEKMITGRLNKELKEYCLLDQQYVKDSELTVAKYLQEVGRKAGAEIVIKGFARYETGEGIQKKEENYAEEVQKQIDQNR